MGSLIEMRQRRKDPAVEVKINIQVSGAEDDPLGAINQLASIANPVDNEVQRCVRLARERGATWEMIAEALGVTKQAAHERFADLLKSTSYSDLVTQARREALRLVEKKQRTDPKWTCLSLGALGLCYEDYLRQIFSESGLRNFYHFRNQVRKSLQGMRMVGHPAFRRFR